MALNVLAVLLMVFYYCAVVSVGVWSGRKMNADSSLQVSRLSVETRRKQDPAHILMKLFIANRHLPLWIGVGSMTATWVGGGYLNGTAEAVYRHGILRCHAPLGYAVSLVLGGTFFARKMRATKPLTMLDPFQNRYGRWMALLLCFPAVVGEVFWTAAILAALGDTAGAIIEVDTRFFILASALVVFFYTSLGGVYVVTHTDVLQIVSMTVCLWICVPFCLRNHAVGLMVPPRSDWVGTIASSDVSQLFDAFLMTALGGIPWQVYFQRVLSCETDFDARMLSYLSAVGCIALAVPPAVIGAVAKSANFTAAGYPGPYYLRDKDVVRVLPYSMRYLTTGFVSMLGLVGITAAIMSSADSSMLSASSMVTKNVYQSIVRPTASDIEVSLVLRVMVFAIGSWATYVALSVNSVFELWLLCSDIVYVLLFPQMICVLYFEDSNTYGAFLELAKRWSWSRADTPKRDTSGMLSYLMPFYLCPVLYPGTKESKCFYCVLLMMSWWQVRPIPRPVLALLPAIALPLLGIMGHEQVATNYFSVDVLTAVLLLWLVLVSDETSTVGRLSYALVGRFGSRAGPVLVLLTASTFVASLVLPQSLVTVFVTCLAERLCNFVRKEGLQDAQRCLDRAVAEDTGGRPCDVDTLMLYEELAVALWKRHRMGLADQDSVECWDADKRGTDSPDPRRVVALKRKMSILKPSKSAAAQDAAGTCTPSATRFAADLPPDKASTPPNESKPPEGKLIRAKRRRQSFADKPHVFEYNEHRRVTHDMPAPQQEEPSTSRTSNPSPWFTPSQQSSVSLRASFRKPASFPAARTAGEGAPVAEATSSDHGSSVSPTSAPKVIGVAASGSAVAFAKAAAPSESATQGLRPAASMQRRVSMAATLGPSRAEPSFGGAGGANRLQARRISIRYPNQPLMPGRDGHRAFQRFRTDERSTVSNAMSSANVPDDEEEDPEELRLRRNQEVLAALCVCGSMTSVAGSIASYWFTPAAEAIAANMDSSSLSFWSWTLITLPVSLAASALSSVCVYYGTLQAHENQLNENAEELIRCYAKLKLGRLERCEIFERLILLFWIGYSGSTIWCRFMHRQDLTTCILGAIVLLASTALSSREGGRAPPSSTSPSRFRSNVDVDGDDTPDFRPPGSDRGLASFASRLPWGVIVIYGAASVITRVAQTTGVAKVAFDTKFWSEQSDLVKQVLLTIASSLMAEFMNAATLCDAILPMVVSLILTGAFVKTVVVAIILLSMNTTGEYVLHSNKQFNNTESLQRFLLR
ncbi:uncharacterized protein LOC142575473 isoform X3 [Dermacentor variabilis]|uniref:uncharacterized protein LOC142575473 isoform X3 n=1 Tax=Dermacentor variabilis TaxID=34621 RepID=UPI003F5C426C